MQLKHVLRVQRGDSQSSDDHVLLNIEDNGKDGELDLAIEGTEGELPYFGKFSHSDLAAAASSTSPFSAEDWFSTLRILFLHQDATPSVPPTSLAITASLKPSSPPPKPSKPSKKPPRPPLTLSIRQTLSPSQLLGTLVIPVLPSHEIDTLAWCASAVSRADALHLQCHGAEQRAAESEDRANKLEAELDQALAEKDATEDKMLRAFVAVLNEKKAKIRQLQSAVAQLRVDNGVVGANGESVKGEGGEVEVGVAERPGSSKGREGRGQARKPEASRRGKRKADGLEPSEEAAASAAKVRSGVEDDDSDDDDGFEDMRRLQDGSNNDEDEDGERHTSEAESEDTPPPASRGIGKLGGIGGKGKGKGEEKGKNEEQRGGVEGERPSIGKLGGIGGRKRSEAEGEDEEEEVGQEGEPQATMEAAKASNDLNTAASASQVSKRSKPPASQPAQTRKANEAASPESDESSDAFEMYPTARKKAPPKPAAGSQASAVPPTRELPFGQWAADGRTGDARGSQKDRMSEQSQSLERQDGGLGGHNTAGNAEDADDDDEETSDDEL